MICVMYLPHKDGQTLFWSPNETMAETERELRYQRQDTKISLECLYVSHFNQIQGDIYF